MLNGAFFPSHRSTAEGRRVKRRPSPPFLVCTVSQRSASTTLIIISGKFTNGGAKHVPFDRLRYRHNRCAWTYWLFSSRPTSDATTAKSWDDRNGELTCSIQFFSCNYFSLQLPFSVEQFPTGGKCPRCRLRSARFSCRRVRDPT
jgi:hypothetical protein